MSELRITQYNVQKSKNKVMAPFVAEATRLGHEIIAIQEPWQNPYMNATYCPGNSGFWPAYPKQFKSRACFLVSKQIQLSAWTIKYPRPDIASLTLRTENRTIHIHNIYSAPPGSLRTIDQESPIYHIPQLLNAEGEHIVVGDFNLHHPIWGGTQCLERHKMADDLLQIINEAGLQLLTPPGEVTWEARGATSTIDLAFSTENIAQLLVRCKRDDQLESGSDHHPITTQLCLNFCQQGPRTRRNWKMMDKGGIAAGAAHLPQPGTLTTGEEIENYTGSLLDFLESLIEKTVPKTKEYTGYSCPWWTAEVKEKVRAARVARRRGAPEEEQKEARQGKKKAILKAKTAHFRNQVHKAATKSNGIWKLVRWAKERSHLPPEPPVIPPLREVRNGVTIREEESLQGKAELLSKRFFPPEPEADTSDMEGYQYPPPVAQLPQIEVEEVQKLISERQSNSAPGADGIPNSFLKALGRPFAEAVAALAQACWNAAYYPKRFRAARTVAIRKPGKDDYTLPKAWRPIALLSTVGKVIEAITAAHIRRLAEKHSMLPAQQMGARPNRSTETALDLIVNQVHTIWQTGNNVASLLSLDITGAFDRVVRKRLTHVLRAKGIPKELALWVEAFMTDRTTTLVLSDTETDEFPVPAGIPQGSPLSPILFLFYAAELLELCNNPSERLSGCGFVDDTNLLAYGPTTEGNCRALARAHDRCLDWARRYGASFAPEKYQLMHLARKPKRFNMKAALSLPGVETEPTTSLRILGVWLDPRLTWGSHIKEVLKRMETQTNALLRTTASTWGATFARARHIYNAVVRPAIAYGAAIWHTPTQMERGVGNHGRANKPTGPVTKLMKIQNKCLRAIAGAYKATPTSVLEVETATPPLDLYLNERIASFRKRQQMKGMQELISAACAQVRRKLAPRRRKRGRTGQTNTEGENRSQWAEKWKRLGRQAVLEGWKRRWSTTQPKWGIIRASAPAEKAPKIHEGLRKAESSILTQIRTGRIGLAAFLNRARVPDFPSPMCQCGRAEETASHIIAFCPRFVAQRGSLTSPPADRLDIRTLVSTPKGAKRIARWFLKLQILPQFRLAEELMREEEEKEREQAGRLGEQPPLGEE